MNNLMFQMLKLFLTLDPRLSFLTIAVARGTEFEMRDESALCENSYRKRCILMKCSTSFWSLKNWKSELKCSLEVRFPVNKATKPKTSTSKSNLSIFLRINLLFRHKKAPKETYELNKIHSKMVIKVTTCTLATSSIPSVAFLSGAVVRATSFSTVCIHITHMASIAAFIDI